MAKQIETFRGGWKWEESWPLSQAVRSGDFVYLAGQVALDSDGNVVGSDLGSQARQTFENIKHLLAKAGAELTDVVKMTTYFVGDITDPAERDKYFKVRREFFGDHQPASTGVRVAGLALQELLLEIDVVAYAPRK